MRDYERELEKAILDDPHPKCDSCGEAITGKSHPMYNEQFEVEEGLIQCDECYVSGLELE